MYFWACLVCGATGSAGMPEERTARAEDHAQRCADGPAVFTASGAQGPLLRISWSAVDSPV